jgi:hypothetical protein
MQNKLKKTKAQRQKNKEPKKKLLQHGFNLSVPLLGICPSFSFAIASVSFLYKKAYRKLIGVNRLLFAA